MTAVYISLWVFGAMVSVAVVAGIIAAISAVVGLSKANGDNDED